MTRKDSVSRREVLAKMKECGAVFEREGGAHEVYRNPRTGENLPVPRHRFISGGVARKLIKLACE